MLVPLVALVPAQHGRSGLDVSLYGRLPLKLERGADFPSFFFTLYSVWTGNAATSTPFNFTGMSADCLFKTNLSDSSAVLTLSPTLGGAAGTYTIPLITAANIETLLVAWPTGIGWWDCRYTNAGSPVRVVDHDRVTISPGVTR